MYEAFLNQDGLTARSLLSECRNEVGHFIPDTKFEKLVVEDEGESGLVQYILAMALHSSIRMVTETFQKLCRMEARIVAENPLSPDLSEVVSVWNFDNLLGAAYLQMYWLMTSAGGLARCQQCGRIISLARPYPKGRKRRQDKRFCNDACRQAHHRSKKVQGHQDNLTEKG